MIRSTPKHTNYHSDLITVCLCLCLRVASRCTAIHLCELNITVPSLTPLCQKLCAQLVSSGALCPNKPAKNEHLGSAFFFFASFTFSLCTQSCLCSTDAELVIYCIMCLFRIAVILPKKGKENRNKNNNKKRYVFRREEV